MTADKHVNGVAAAGKHGACHPSTEDDAAVTSRASITVVATATTWFALASVLVATGRVAMQRPPIPQVIVAVLTCAVLIASRRLPVFRHWLRDLPISRVIAFHLVRFVGYAFLWLTARGAMPAAFAVPAGIGDITVATGALLLLVVPRTPSWYRFAWGWNMVGLIDIVFVVVTAARLAMADPDSMLSLMRFPLGLLPTFVVPLIIASHVWLFGALRTSSHRQRR